MPNRVIKESICSSESLSKLSDFEENLFYKLIVNCDDYGRFDARPAIVKSRCYPLRDNLRLDTIKNALLQLEHIGCIRLYENAGKPYLCLPSWEAHQQIRAKRSKYPAPDNICNQMISDDNECPRNPIQSESESNINAGIISEIIDYLNLKSNKGFTKKNKSFNEHINARISDGRTIDDFKHVIDVKCEEWLDTDMEKYLSPDTLFRPSKFDKYITQKLKSPENPNKRTDGRT